MVAWLTLCQVTLLLLTFSDASLGGHFLRSQSRFICLIWLMTGELVETNLSRAGIQPDDDSRSTAQYRYRMQRYDPAVIRLAKDVGPLPYQELSEVFWLGTVIIDILLVSGQYKIQCIFWRVHHNLKFLDFDSISRRTIRDSVP
jgi:hypothetical protein